MNVIEDVVETTAELETLLKANGGLGSGLRPLAESIPEFPLDLLDDVIQISRLRNRVVHQAHRPGVVDLEQFHERAFRVREYLNLKVAARLPGVARTYRDLAVSRPVRLVVKRFEPPPLHELVKPDRKHQKTLWVRFLNWLWLKR